MKFVRYSFCLSFETWMDQTFGMNWFPLHDWQTQLGGLCSYHLKRGEHSAVTPLASYVNLTLALKCRVTFPNVVVTSPTIPVSISPRWKIVSAGTSRRKSDGQKKTSCFSEKKRPKKFSKTESVRSMQKFFAEVAIRNKHPGAS